MSLISELFWGLYPAQLFSSLVSFLSSLVNGLIVGNTLEPIAMVALGFVSPFNAIIAALSSVLAGGSRVLCGRFLGTGDTKSIDKTFTICTKVIVILGAVLTAVSFILATPIASLLGAQGESIQYTANYLKGLSVGIIFAMLLPCLMTFLQMGNDSKFALALAAILAVSNAVFALVFVKIFKMGVFGAGLSTSLSQFVTVLVGIIRFKKKAGLMHLTKERDNTGILKKMILIGIPSAVAAILYPTRNILINSMSMTIAGENAVGALAILGSCGGFFDAFNIAMGTTVLMISSLGVGEKDSEFVKNLGKYCCIIGLLIGLAKVAVLAFLGGPIACLFGAAGERIQLSKELLFAYSLSMPLNMIVITIMNVYLSLGKLKEVNIVNVLSAFVFPIAFILILRNVLNIQAVWYCYSAAEVLTLLTILVIFLFKEKHFPKNFLQIFYTTEIVPPSGSLKFYVCNMNDISSVSEKTSAFCLDHGIEARRSMLSGLALEEMSRNIIENNLSKRKSKKPLSIEIFAMCNKESVNLRIRDNGISYNIEDIDSIYNSDDPFNNIGIKIVSKISSEMNYMTPFGMNVLNIKI